MSTTIAIPFDARSPAGGVSDVQRTAIAYTQLGFSVVPLHPRSKRPIENDWQRTCILVEEILERVPPDANLGIRLGTSPVGIVADVDCDAAEARAIAPRLLLPTARFERASAPGSHFLYLTDAPISTERFKDPVTGDTLIELRCLKENGEPGMQTMSPPSIHPDTGEAIRWVDGFQSPPTLVSAAELHERVAEIASITLLAVHCVSKGYRHAACNALAGALAYAGWNEERASLFVSLAVEHARTSDDAHVRQAPRNVADTFEKFRNGGAVTGWPALIELGVPEPVVRKVKEWLAIGQTTTLRTATAQAAGALPAPWEDPIPIENPLPPVDPFDKRLLPEVFRPFVEDAAQRMQAPLDFIAVPLLVAFAGAVGRRFRIYPKRVDETWTVVPNLWGAIVAPPGFLKTPSLEAALHPLRQIEAGYAEEHKVALAQYGLDRETEAQQLRAWDQACVSAYKKSETPPERPPQTACEPTAKRSICNDATWEAVHRILSTNPAGILVVRDELAGWLALLDRPGREGERAFFLEAWNGTGSFTMDRIERGSIRTDACCISLLGGIQPGRLRAYLANAVDGGPGDDGLIQRLQLAVSPDLPRWRYIDQLPKLEAIQSVLKLFQGVVKLDPSQPLIYHFEPKAQELFKEWIEELADTTKDSDLHPALVGHLSKYRSLMPSIAGLHQFIDDPDASEISVRCAQQAAAYCSYLEPHARRIYASMLSPQIGAAHRLAEKIHTRKLGEKFTLRDVYFKTWSGLDSPDKARNALAVLEGKNWVRPVAADPARGAGRPPETFEVNPAVFSLKKRREAETEQVEQEAEDL